MSIFQSVKESVTARQAAEQYGLKVNRNGMVCCPFHKDRHPSMKVEKGFYCFACGAKGDVITFTGKLFGMSPYEAAKKLITDFNLPIPLKEQKSVQNKSRDREGKKVQSRYHFSVKSKVKTWKNHAVRMIRMYMVVLRNDPLVRESMKYNKLTGRIDIVKKLWWNEEICKLDDDGRTYFYYFFERYYKLTSEKCMDKALRIEANSRAYHPICEYLEQLEWDGQERIRYVLQVLQ